MDASLILRDLAEARSRGIARSQRIGRTVRALTLGLARTGATEAAELEHRLVEAVRAAQARPRVVAVLSGSGGTGTTTTAAGIATTLAALRSDPVVLADAQTGTASLSARLAGDRRRPAAPTVADVARHGARALPGAAHGGLGIVDAAPHRDPVTPAGLRRVLAALTAGHAFVVLDLGDDAGDVSRLADRAVVVTAPTAAAVDGTRRVLDRLWRADPAAAGTAAVAVVCPEPAAHRRLVRRLHEELSADVARIVLVPYDQALPGPGPLDPARLRPATREAYLALAALVAG
ncbi:hypothetical protein KZZ52_27745 [Dactylosporangium sp. AC04546]|uniref:hypothetical protein n=1 Tax=Dactylosporangium sp. AC04546 TaxID=2862460 RepID=UPI001EE0CA98|nr:hypothetical protein [Dactylosporangium sp. AC04546]WVK89060.1 hypothetical protein KZZ52_27745 [Dactylosporangium sp. AC04546]